MTIRHFKIFVAVAETGKMCTAAERLHISQPSVSQAIRELEEYYGVLLFERLSQRIYITEHGKDFLSYARRAVEAFEQAEKIAFGAAKREIVRIGGSVSVGTMLLPEIVKKLQQKQPDADIRVVVDNTTMIEKLVEQNELDIALVEGIVKSDRLIQQGILEDELMLVAGREHPFYFRKSVTIEELEGQSFISRENGSSERNQFEQFLAEHQIRMRSAWICSNTEAIKQAVLNGEGLAILSKLLIQKELESGVLKRVTVDGVTMKRTLKLIYNDKKYFNSAMNMFVELCGGKKEKML